MSIRWDEEDVIKAFEEAMKEQRNGTGTNKLLQQLKAKAQGQPQIVPPRVKE